VVVPPYCQSRQGRVFRLLRSAQFVSADRVRYALRAVPIASSVTEIDHGLEAVRELDATEIRDKLANRQAIPTPEQTFEQLWHQLQQDLEQRYG
jgi:hypothetical protein